MSRVLKDEWSSPREESEEEHSRQRHQLGQWNTGAERHAIFGHGEKFIVVRIGFEGEAVSLFRVKAKFP